MHDMVNDVVVMTTAVVVEGAAAARATGTTPAAQVLVSAAPGLPSPFLKCRWFPVSPRISWFRSFIFCTSSAIPKYL